MLAKPKAGLFICSSAQKILFSKTRGHVLGRVKRQKKIFQAVLFDAEGPQAVAQGCWPCCPGGQGCQSGSPPAWGLLLHP